MRKAVVSISSNIAEGAGRGSDTDFRRILLMATGSSNELEAQLLAVRDLGIADYCLLPTAAWARTPPHTSTARVSYSCFMPIDPQLLSIMVCPVSHAPLREVGDWLVSTDPETRFRYPVRDGIPVMLTEESEEMGREEWEQALQKEGTDE